MKRLTLLLMLMAWLAGSANTTELKVVAISTPWDEPIDGLEVEYYLNLEFQNMEQTGSQGEAYFEGPSSGGPFDHWQSFIDEQDWWEWSNPADGWVDTGLDVLTHTHYLTHNAE